MDFIKELQWRGMIHDIMPGTEKLLKKGMTTGYIGFDPTADSLGIGNMVQIMTLVHFQSCGHQPIALIGGATGMVGDPSGKSEERNLLDEEVLRHNLACQRKQLEKFLDFDTPVNPAKIINNYDWFKNMDFLSFIRDVGKHISINYMMAKDSVKTRLESGMSFTEFTYQLVQGYDFYHLYTHYNCKLQMGGSDQWGNIVTGSELIRRKANGEGFALTTPLIKKADGTKFGKTASGNIWLDKDKTSPYKFYQYWLNSADEDAETYIKIFSTHTREEIEGTISEHRLAPHQRLLQKTLAEELTVRVHSEEALLFAISASQILFGKDTSEALKKLTEAQFLEVMEGVPQTTISKTVIENNTPLVNLLSEHSGFIKSKGEARRALEESSISVNKEKVKENFKVDTNSLIAGKYLLLQRGKKNYFILAVH